MFAGISLTAELVVDMIEPRSLHPRHNIEPSWEIMLACTSRSMLLKEQGALTSIQPRAVNTKHLDIIQGQIKLAILATLSMLGPIAHEHDSVSIDDVEIIVIVAQVQGAVAAFVWRL
jgi:hypothetical protein